MHARKKSTLFKMFTFLSLTLFSLSLPILQIALTWSVCWLTCLGKEYTSIHSQFTIPPVTIQVPTPEMTGNMCSLFAFPFPPPQYAHLSVRCQCRSRGSRLLPAGKRGQSHVSKLWRAHRPALRRQQGTGGGGSAAAAAHAGQSARQPGRQGQERSLAAGSCNGSIISRFLHTRWQGFRVSELARLLLQHAQARAHFSKADNAGVVWST